MPTSALLEREHYEALHPRPGRDKPPLPPNSHFSSLSHFQSFWEPWTLEGTTLKATTQNEDEILVASPTYLQIGPAHICNPVGSLLTFFNGLYVIYGHGNYKQLREWLWSGYKSFWDLWGFPLYSLLFLLWSLQFLQSHRKHRLQQVACDSS